ncbi:23S rRNA (adenine(1618)-N(6))-methyltransferase RlmF [Horticoccus sp. 23ND18S-11]|uniref:23S rRNA (adenine(1618)-N(6))-methyltransferase RlmF n=1 Tax=Horticoccus sp. 23ND18S-11 TaxID=3391832 RepID=UPI0039C99FB2
MHPRNQHQGRYDFPQLIQRSPELARHVRPTGFGDDSIDFADPTAVTALNRALLQLHYGVSSWVLPPGYLCPAIPGRADYVHHLADLLAGAGGTIPCGDRIRVLDIGTGASVVYPIIGVHAYDWSFVASDIDVRALESARAIVAANPVLAARIECRRQTNPLAIFAGVITPGESFALTLCNPPFHASAAAAATGTQRKQRNLGRPAAVASPPLNFGGQSHELWCPGGEAAFIRRMIAESVAHAGAVHWFSTLVSKRETLPLILRALTAARATDVRTVTLAHGQKQSRFVAWTFRRVTPPRQRERPSAPRPPSAHKR